MSTNPVLKKNKDKQSDKDSSDDAIQESGSDVSES